MIPGPVDAEDDVLAAMAEPIRPHYGDEWLTLYHETVGLLQQIFGTQNELFLMAGPGTAAFAGATCSCP